MGDELDKGYALEARDALLFRETMDATIEVCWMIASSGAVECLDVVLCWGDDIGGSRLANSLGSAVGVWIAVDEHLECLGPGFGRELGLIEEDGQILPFTQSV